jgi:hypothetical protein
MADEDQIKLPPGYVLHDPGETPTVGSVLKLPPGYVPVSPKDKDTRKLVAQGTGEAVADAPSFFGKLGVNSLPMAGAMAAGVPGTLTGSALKTLIQHFAPDTFGKGPEDAGDTALEMGKDVIGQNLIPGAVQKGVAALIQKGLPAAVASSKLLKNFPAVRSGAAKNMTDEALGKYQFPESGILESAAENASGTNKDLIDQFNQAKATHMASDEYAIHPSSSSPEMAAAEQAQKDVFGRNAVGSKLLRLQKQFERGEDVSGRQTYKSIAGEALSDLTHVRNFKLATGEPKTIEQLALNDLVTDGFKSSEGTLNTKGILDKLTGPKSEIYREAISPPTLGKFQELMSEIEAQKAGHGISDRMLNWSKGHLAWSIPLAASSMGGHSLIGGMGALATGSILTNSALGKIMSNPETAALVVKAMRTSTSSPEAPFIAKALANAVRGGEVVSESSQ